MCTLSIISGCGTGDRRGFRIVCNRDEHRERSEASPPAWRTLAGGLRAVWPTDTHAGGTWIAAGDHGLVLAVLNLQPSPPVDVLGIKGLLSRGALIPELIGLRDGAEVVRCVSARSLERFAPFRMVVADPGEGGAWRWWRRSAGPGGT